MKKWEYKEISIPDSEYDNRVKLLNSIGEQGWELIGWGDDVGFGINYLLKRLKEDDLDFNVMDRQVGSWMRSRREQKVQKGTDGWRRGISER